MTTYMIFLKEETFDTELLGRYTQKALPLLEKTEATALAFNGYHQVLEGAPLESIAIIRFPSREDALAFYNSPAYQEAAAIRKEASRMSVMIVEGLSSETV